MGPGPGTARPVGSPCRPAGSCCCWASGPVGGVVGGRGAHPALGRLVPPGGCWAPPGGLRTEPKGSSSAPPGSPVPSFLEVTHSCAFRGHLPSVRVLSSEAGVVREGSLVETQAPGPTVATQMPETWFGARGRPVSHQRTAPNPYPCVKVPVCQGVSCEPGVGSRLTNLPRPPDLGWC